jgi:hypothetical protein
MTGHGIPRFAPRPRTTFEADLVRNATQIRRLWGFILARNSDTAKDAPLLLVIAGREIKGMVAGTRFNLRPSGYEAATKGGFYLCLRRMLARQPDRARRMCRDARRHLLILFEDLIGS